MGVVTRPRFLAWRKTDYQKRIAELKKAITKDLDVGELSLRDDYAEQFARLSFWARSSKASRATNKILYSRYVWLGFVGLLLLLACLGWIFFQFGLDPLSHDIIRVAILVLYLTLLLLYLLWMITVLVVSYIDNREIAKRHEDDVLAAKYLRRTFDIAALSLIKERLDQQTKVDIIKAVVGSSAFVGLAKFEVNKIVDARFVLDWTTFIPLVFVALFFGLLLGRRSLASKLRGIVSLAIPK